jgi:hypothetical protein
MMRRIAALTAIFLFVPATLAGVVFESEVMIAAAPEKSGVESFYAQGEMTRADFSSPEGGSQSVIFKDQTIAVMTVEAAGTVSRCLADSRDSVVIGH